VEGGGGGGGVGVGGGGGWRWRWRWKVVPTACWIRYWLLCGSVSLTSAVQVTPLSALMKESSLTMSIVDVPGGGSRVNVALVRWLPWIFSTLSPLAHCASSRHIERKNSSSPERLLLKCMRSSSVVFAGTNVLQKAMIALVLEAEGSGSAAAAVAITTQASRACCSAVLLVFIRQFRVEGLLGVGVTVHPLDEKKGSGGAMAGGETLETARQRSNLASSQISKDWHQSQSIVPKRRRLKNNGRPRIPQTLPHIRRERTA
jgi:hypothetical protein